MAATVIASGEIDGNATIPAMAVKGLLSLTETATTASLALASPVLSFLQLVVGFVDATLTYRQMQQRISWVELEEIVEFANTLARRLALNQQKHIAAGFSQTDASFWLQIKNQCTLWLTSLKAGDDFTLGEQRALLDAKLIFEYMLQHAKPADMTLNGRVDVLLKHLTGATAPTVVIAPVVSRTVPQPAASVTATADDHADSGAPHSELDRLRNEIATLKAEQAKQRDTLQTVQDMQAKQKTTFTEIEVGADQIQLQQQVQTGQLAGSAPHQVLSYVYGRVVAHEGAIADLGTHAATLGEQVATLDKSKKDEQAGCFVM